MKLPTLFIAASLAALACVAQAELAGPGPIDRASAEHYTWAGVNDGWHLVKRPDMSVIEERIAPGSAEVRHFHEKARQFFYVLSGELTMEVAGQTKLLKAGQGIEIVPGTPHQAQNQGTAPVRILVNSTPPSHGDRVAAPMPDVSDE